VTGKRRGLETALDMVRTLAVVFAVVLPLWFFGRSSPEDSKRIRPVDPTAAYADFVHDTHGPVPSAAPAGWTCTVRVYGEDGLLRVGYVEGDHYLEFAGARSTDFLIEETGHGTRVGTVPVNGVPWQDYRSADGHRSLVLTRGGVTVLVGGVRETATDAQLLELAASVR
jgi:hypothetical protein